MRAVALLVIVVLALSAALPGVAATGGAADVATDVANNVMSPFCPGLTLHDCPSEAAVQLRERIERWARDGATRTEITARLEREYGEAILATPPREGTGLVAWLLPAVMVAAGAVVAWGLARRWSAPSETPRPPEASAEDRSVLAAELAELRRKT